MVRRMPLFSLGYVDLQFSVLVAMTTIYPIAAGPGVASEVGELSGQ